MLTPLVPGTHAIQALCELNPDATVTSVDGIRAYDSISRKAVLEGLMQVEESSAILPFVRMFHGVPELLMGRCFISVSSTPLPREKGARRRHDASPLCARGNTVLWRRRSAL